MGKAGAAEAAVTLLQAMAEVDPKDVEGFTPLHWAAFHGHARVAEALVVMNADINVKDTSEQSPLHWAARAHTEVAQVLLEARADTNMKDAEGHVPADWAEQGCHDEIVKLLGVEAGRRRIGTPPWVLDVAHMADAAAAAANDGANVV